MFKSKMIVIIAMVVMICKFQYISRSIKQNKQIHTHMMGIIQKTNEFKFTNNYSAIQMQTAKMLIYVQSLDKVIRINNFTTKKRKKKLKICVENFLFVN